ncbi:MAG: hypothetical protein DWC09_01065 [Candidatus Poseidoniales archaeon]|nr:MAG: hypothetical protein DWC09_01065 [Candidatus Poseidoniales archaeon]
MSLQLELDHDRHVQEHLNELTSRTTLVFFLATVFTVGWLTQIDQILNVLLNRLNPCDAGCLNLYDPARWSAVRWMSAAILGIATATPIAFYHGWKFARPGLLPNEQRWVASWFIGGGLILGFAVLTTIGVVFPFLFQTGHQTHESMMLDARYDAVHMLSMAVAVVWTQVIVACALSAMVLAGAFGMLHRETADWWRFRVYGIVLLLLLASLPEYGGFAIILAASAIGIIERGSRRWLRANPPLFNGKKPIMDADGGVRNMLLVDCSCDGAANRIPPNAKSPMAVLPVTTLCHSTKEQEKVIETALSHRLTDVIVSGCTTEPLPDDFKQNCRSIGCKLRGLDMLGLQSYRTLPSPFEITEFELKILSLEDPWSKQSIPNRMYAAVKDQVGIELLLDTRSKENAWGMQLEPQQILVHLDKHTANSVEVHLSSLPIQIRQL